MATIKTYKSGKVGDTKIDDALFGERLHPVVLREAVLMYQANKRVGTAQTRTRRFVNGTSAKMYKQKHTGRARHGDKKAPGMRGGGVAHGPHPRDYSYKMPRKALKQALKVALSGKLRDGEIHRWEGASFDKPSTKGAIGVLEKLGASQSALFVYDAEADRNLRLSVRNLRRVKALSAAEVNAYDLVAHNDLVLLDGALETLLGRIGGAEEPAPAAKPAKAKAAKAKPAKAAAPKAAAPKAAAPKAEAEKPEDITEAFGDAFDAAFDKGDE